MKRLTYLLLCLFASIAFATAQTTKVTGTVISAEDDGPIIGASIVVAGTTTGTVTDYNGAFTLDVPSNAKKLIVSYIGMKSVEVAVNQSLKSRWSPTLRTWMKSWLSVTELKEKRM